MNKIPRLAINLNEFDYINNTFNGYDSDDECENGFYDDFDDIQPGNYNVVFDYFDECTLLQEDKIKYKLNCYSSIQIKKRLKKLKVPKQDYKMDNYNNDKYDAVLICEIKEDMKYLTFGFKNKIYKFTSTKNLERLKPNSQYVIDYFNKEDRIIRSNDKYYKVQSNLLEILDKHFDCDNNKIYGFNNTEETTEYITKLTIVTGKEKSKKYKSVELNLYIEMNGKKFLYFVNKIDDIDYNNEGRCIFLTFFIHNKLLVGYDCKNNKYCFVPKYYHKRIFPYFDKEIVDKFINKKDQELYTYMKKDNVIKCLVLDLKKDKEGKIRTSYIIGGTDLLFKKVLDINQLGTNDIETDENIDIDSDNDDINIDEDSSELRDDNIDYNIDDENSEEIKDDENKQ